MTTEAPDIAIRLARPEDRGFIIELCARTFADLGDYRATVAGWLDGTDTIGIIASRDGRARGAEEAAGAAAQIGAALLAARRAIGFGRRPAAELLAIALHPGARGQGIGRLLLERAERIARGWEATEMRLHTADSNLRAQRFFSAAGYEPRPAKTTAYPSGETALAFARSLR